MPNDFPRLPDRPIGFETQVPDRPIRIASPNRVERAYKSKLRVAIAAISNRIRKLQRKNVNCTMENGSTWPKS